MTVIETASTNRPETRVTIGRQAKAMVRVSGTRSSTIPLGTEERKRIWKAVSDAEPLENLPVSHCMKSASFGSSLFVEIDGQRSPDLSCANQADPRAAALHAEARGILQAVAAKEKAPKWKQD